MTEQKRIHDKQWSLIVAKAWADPEFKERLTANPKTILLEHGLEFAPETAVKVVEDSDPGEDTEQLIHFTLPPSPGDDLSEEELSPVGVAYCYSGGCHRCGRCGCGCVGCGRCGCDAS